MIGMKPPIAMFQEPAGGAVRCRLCAHLCVVRPGRRGICKVRENRGGTLVTLSYGMLSSLAVDPIEKKPLFHFLPGSRSLSIATAGCNMRCPWCQNHSLSRLGGRAPSMPGRWTEPEEIVEAAVETRSASVSYTYSEPTIFYEYARAVGTLARGKGMRNVFVTNGHITPEAVRDAAESFLDAANVDLKGATKSFYRHRCKARIEAVRDSIALMRSLGLWVEVTTLVIPGENDSDADLASIAELIASVDASIPWHVSRFHPDHEFRHAPATPIESLERAARHGRQAGLRYVYMGNVWGGGGEDTACPSCGAVVMRRHGFSTQIEALQGNACGRCGMRIDGVFA